MSFDENKCLKINPFEGDFGTPNDKILKDKIVTARKTRACGMCCQEIQKGERIRVLAAVFDGELMNYSWCSKCCDAMSKILVDNGFSWEARVNLGNEHLQAIIRT